MEFETWFARIGLAVTFILVLLLIKREFRKRECDETEERSTCNHYSQWLHRFSISTMILCALLLLFGILKKIPIICKYTYSVPTLIWGSVPTSLTMYQIVRLQYVFSKNQVHSNFGMVSIFYYFVYLWSTVNNVFNYMYLV